MYTATRHAHTDKNHVFRFLIKRGSVTRTTITIQAKDISDARNRLQALHPGSDLSETEVEHIECH